MNKKLFFGLITTAYFMTSYIPVFSAPVAPGLCDGSKSHPCIVQDTPENTPVIRHWRTNQMIDAAYKGNTTGLKNLWVSGSAIPSAQAFKTIATNIKTITQNKATHIIDVDVQQETHAYVNNRAINLTANNDWINLGNTEQQINNDEAEWIHFISTQKMIYNVLTPKQFKSHDFSNGMNISVQTVADEKIIAEQAGFSYVRIPATDHLPPLDADVNKFVDLVKQLPPQTWLHIHCRGGDGRTTTFMAMYDMLRNANKVSFNDIIARQASVPPYYDLSKISRKNATFNQDYQQRYEFLKRFYQYAQASLQGYKGTWTEWKQK